MGERLSECWSTSVRYISGGESSDAVVRLKILWTIDSCVKNYLYQTL